MFEMGHRLRLCQLIIDLPLHRLFEHAWRQIDASEAFPQRPQQRTGQPGAATEIQNARKASSHHQQQGLELFGDVIVENFYELLVVIVGKMVEISNKVIIWSPIDRL